MRSCTSDTALLLFTRTPQEEAREKPLLPHLGQEATAAVFEKMIRHARSLGRESGLPCFVVTSDQQVGNCFGERFYQALASVFSRGFRSVIAIGNDCPQLTVRELEMARAALAAEKPVLGPATDGGVYLLGVTAAQLADEKAFLRVRWNSSLVLADLELILRQPEGGLTLLRPLTDLDDGVSFEKALQKKQLHPQLLRALQSILASLSAARPQAIFGPVIPLFFSRALSFRGPPARS
ncbi:hypothetical protein BH24BAC1_BH24BAC1_34830 [soil metagenome]